MRHKFLPGSIVADPTLGARQIKVTANSGQLDRVGDVLVASGCKLDNYRRNPIVLNSHDPTKPVGTARVYVAGDRLEAIIDFAPLGASRDADEICALAKAGILGAVSVGFRPIKSEPIRSGLGGERFTEWELLELSCVAVPCDPGALVIARSMQGKSGRVLNARNSTSLHALIRCLGKSADAHCEVLEMLEEADKHRAKAMRHAATIAASQGDDGTDDSDPDDPDDDNELALDAARRKRVRIAEAFALAGGAPYAAPDVARRKREAEALALAAI
jgi:HK97 family phage prohead protease